MEDDKNKYVRANLLKKYPPDTFGRWRILGEDSNCDFGGSHYQPHLETVTGTYSNVVEYAISLNSFFTWGGGGDIIQEETHIKNIDKVVSNPRIKQLEKERKEAQARLGVIEQELEVLNKGR